MPPMDTHSSLPLLMSAAPPQLPSLLAGPADYSRQLTDSFQIFSFVRPIQRHCLVGKETGFLIQAHSNEPEETVLTTFIWLPCEGELDSSLIQALLVLVEKRHLY